MEFFGMSLLQKSQGMTPKIPRLPIQHRERLAGGIMYILRLSIISLILATAVALFLLGHPNYSFAAPPCSKNPVEGCRDDSEPDPADNSCDIKFSVTFDDLWSDAIRSDYDSYPIAGGEYPDPDDSKDKSGAFNGKGDGLRFDTNGTGPLLSNNDKRRAHVDLQPTGDTFGGIDFRFHQNLGGLSLCDMTPGDNAQVAMQLRYDNSAGDEFFLLYGCYFHSGALIADVGTTVTVVRGEEGDAAIGTWKPDNTWTLVGTTACVQTVNAHATGSLELLGDPQEVVAPFLMTLTAQ